MNNGETIKVSCYSSLKNLLEELKERGVKEKEFDKVEFEHSYDDCYYENDTPSIVATLTRKKNAKTDKI
jgi:hypothetical protein